VAAADGLCKLGKASEDLVPVVLSPLEDKNFGVRSDAAETLGNLGNASQQVVDALLRRLADEHSRVRGNAAFALGKLGKNSSDVASAVAQWISQHQDSEYVGSGIDALWQLVATDG
jgi:hypothetical protein